VLLNGLSYCKDIMAQYNSLTYLAQSLFFGKGIDLTVINELWEEMQFALQSRTRRVLPLQSYTISLTKWSGFEGNLVTDY
jgi:hypothetical protein